MLRTTNGWSKAIPVFAGLALVLTIAPASAQNANGTVKGTIADPSGKALVGASVTLEDASGNPLQRGVTDAQGAYSFANVAAGRYDLAVSATGFSTDERPVTLSGTSLIVNEKLEVASVAEEVVVEAEDNSSLAVQSAPVKSLLDAASARTEITSNYISEYTSPVTDFADIIQAAPGTVSFNTNGIGNGQAKIYFRGFIDDDYSMTWDGVPFNDSNDPSHHSWAYVPAAAIGHVDFDRSPGTASDVATSNFGGTIHFFSPTPSDDAHVRAEATYGSWNTYQILSDINSGAFMHGKAHFWLNGDYQSSDGYQTFSPKQDEAITAKFTYKFSDRTFLSVIGTDIILDAFNNNDPTRRQLLHHGVNYLYDNTETNAGYASTSKYYYDPQFWRFSVYHVPSFFYIVSFDHDFGKNWKLTTKSYSYGYSNHQHYQNKTDQDLTTDSILTTVKNEQVGGTDQLGWVAGTTPTGIDKLNQYARGGEIADLSHATRWGVIRVGSWYELTNTLRYQIYTDPLTWVDSPYLNDIKFHEHFYTTAVQPYAELQLVSIPNVTVTAGVKDAFYRMNLTQYADGHTIGQLTCPTTTGTLSSSCTATTQHAQNYNSILPSLEANYRVTNNASLYGQYGRGSIAPYSSVFDTAGAQVAVTPPPTIANTFQGGTVVKLNRVAFDADVYHIHFTNTYSTYTDSTVSDPNYGFTYYYAQPNSDTNGFEAEGNVAVTRSLGLNANGTLGAAKYEASGGSPAVTDATGATITPAVGPTQTTWVALAPHDTESMGLTYRQRGIDFGVFGKRIGSRWNDIGSFHQNVPLDPFWMSNLFLNYNIAGRSILSGSKIKLSIDNLFDDHSIVANSAANDGTTLASTTVNKALVVTQNNQLYSPSWADSVETAAGRSIMISIQFGLTRHAE